jgi:PucR family transcriptional regulator, purine catabolism regulatory protein
VSPITVAQVAAEPALRLRVLVDPGSLDGLVRGAHISDLERPGRYVLPGEFVLTNGLWVDHAEAERWIADVHSAGAIAVGFGVCERIPEVPEAVLEACRAAALPLLEVPEDVSFSALSECIQIHNASAGAASRLQLLRVRRLLHELARGEGHAAVLDLLRRETRLPVWLVGPGGRSLTDDVLPDPSAAAAAARAARRDRLPCALPGDLCAFGVGGAPLSTSTVLVAAPLAEISDDTRLVIEQVAAYVVLEDARRRERETARSQLADELVRLAWTGELGAAACELRLRATGLDPDGPVMVLASSNDGPDVTYASLGCTPASVVARHEDVQLLLVQSDDGAVIDEVAELIRDGGADPVLGAGCSAGGPDGLREAMAAALSAQHLAALRPPGERIVRELAIGSYTLLLDFVDPRVLRTFRDEVLGPVERWDTEHDADLVATLAAFLVNNGHWRRTAAGLHIHHNTLHYRIDKIAQLTGRDAGTTAGRVDFTLALAIRREGG